MDASKKIRVATEVWSGRQGCNPAGESPVVPVARFRHVVMPHPGMGNHPGYAWCNRLEFRDFRVFEPRGNVLPTIDPDIGRFTMSIIVHHEGEGLFK